MMILTDKKLEDGFWYAIYNYCIFHSYINKKTILIELLLM